MREVAILLERDLKMLKNYLLAMRHNPKRLLVFLLYLAYMVWVIWINRSNSSGPGTFNPALMGGAAMLFVAMTLLINISVSLKEMLSFFKPSDVSIVFTSPLKPRAVMAAALIKSAMSSVLLTLFLVVIGGRFMLPEGAPNTGYILMILVFVLFNMSIQPLNFMLIRFKTRLPLMTTQVVFTGLWLLPTLILLLINGADVMRFPTWSATNWIPVIGWLKAIVLASYGYDVPGIWIIACLYSLYTLGVLFGAIYLATDYYEDVISGTEKFASLRQRAKEGKQIETNTKAYKKRALNLVKRNPQTLDNTAVRQDDGKYTGELAFFWKEKTIAAKFNFHPIFGNKEILYLLGALIIALASYGVSENLKWLPYGYNGGLVYIIFLMTLSGKGQVEFMTPRFLMTPGKITIKLLGIYGLPAIRHALAMVLVNLILLASDNVSPLILLICFVGQIILYIEVLYINLLMHGFLQNSTDVAIMLPLMKVLQIFILFAPNILLAIKVGMMTESFYWVALSLGVLNILMIGVLVLLTSWFVKRIEVQN